MVCHLDMPKVALFEDPPMSASGTVGGRLKGGWGSHWSSLVAVGRCGPGTELWQELCTNGTGNRHTLPPRHPVDGGAAPMRPASAAERESLARRTVHQHVYGLGGSSCSRRNWHVVCVVGSSPSVLIAGYRWASRSLTDILLPL